MRAIAAIREVAGAEAQYLFGLRRRYRIDVAAIAADGPANAALERAGSR
jgi:hypothetical protein